MDWHSASRAGLQGAGRTLSTLALLLAMACGVPDATDRGAAPTDFVVFRDRDLVLDRLNVPSAVPVSVGSTVTGGRLISSAPDVVSVTPDGQLLAHRAGEAVISVPADPSQSLRVRVQPASAIRLDPAEIVLEPGSSAELALIADSGVRIQPSDATWATADPAVATAFEGKVEARRTGSARIVATYAGQKASATIAVRAADSGAFSIVPWRPQARAGDALTFQAASREGVRAATWALQPTNVLKQVGPATFVAQRPGEGTVCATVGLRTVCTSVFVDR